MRDMCYATLDESRYRFLLPFYTRRPFCSSQTTTVFVFSCFTFLCFQSVRALIFAADTRLAELLADLRVVTHLNSILDGPGTDLQSLSPFHSLHHLPTARRSFIQHFQTYHSNTKSDSMFFRASTLTLFLLPLVALAQDNNNSGNNDDSDCRTSYNDQRGA